MRFLIRGFKEYFFYFFVTFSRIQSFNEGEEFIFIPVEVHTFY
jgi:hypothetical protein